MGQGDWISNDVYWKGLKGKEIQMKIVVDEMPTYPYECRNCRLEGDIEFHNWVCQVGEEKHVCKDVRDCPYFIGLDEVLKNEKND